MREQSQSFNQYIGAPEVDPRTDAQKAADAPTERAVSGAGGFIAGALIGTMIGIVLSGYMEKKY